MFGLEIYICSRCMPPVGLVGHLSSRFSVVSLRAEPQNGYATEGECGAHRQRAKAWDSDASNW